MSQSSSIDAASSAASTWFRRIATHWGVSLSLFTAWCFIIAVVYHRAYLSYFGIDGHVFSLDLSRLLVFAGGPLVVAAALTGIALLLQAMPRERWLRWWALFVLWAILMGSIAAGFYASRALRAASLLTESLAVPLFGVLVWLIAPLWWRYWPTKTDRELAIVKRAFQAVEKTPGDDKGEDTEGASRARRRQTKLRRRADEILAQWRQPMSESAKLLAMLAWTGSLAATYLQVVYWMGFSRAHQDFSSGQFLALHDDEGILLKVLYTDGESALVAKRKEGQFWVELHSPVTTESVRVRRPTDVTSRIRASCDELEQRLDDVEAEINKADVTDTASTTLHSTCVLTRVRVSMLAINAMIGSNHELYKHETDVLELTKAVGELEKQVAEQIALRGTGF